MGPLRRAVSVLLVPASVALAACTGAPADPAAPSAAETAFVDEAGRIDPRIVLDQPAAIGLGAEVCRELADGRSPAEIALAVRRFTGGESVITAEQSAQLIESARRHLCR